MLGCVDFGDIRNFMNDVTSDVNRMGNYMDQAGDELVDAAEEINEVLGEGTGDVSLKCDGPSSRHCCGYTRSGNEWKESETSIRVTDIENCDDNKNFALWNDETKEKEVAHSYSAETIELFEGRVGGYTYDLAADENTETYNLAFFCGTEAQFTPSEYEEQGKEYEQYRYCKGDDSQGCTTQNCGTGWAAIHEPEITIQYPQGGQEIKKGQTLHVNGEIDDLDIKNYDDEVTVKIEVLNTPLPKRTEKIRRGDCSTGTDCDWDVTFSTSDLDIGEPYTIEVKATDIFGLGDEEAVSIKIICNGNGVCESGYGENTQNCPQDCPAGQ